LFKRSPHMACHPSHALTIALLNIEPLGSRIVGDKGNKSLKDSRVISPQRKKTNGSIIRAAAVCESRRNNEVKVGTGSTRTASLLAVCTL
jgi:hypothetical protein